MRSRDLLSTINRDIKHFAFFYLTCFIAYYAWNLWHGLTFHQIQPVFFYNRLDFIGNILLLSGVHVKLLQSRSLQLLFDLVYLFLPILITIFVVRNLRYKWVVVLFTMLFNLLYAFCFSIMSFVSINSMLAFMIVPFVFAFKKGKDFNLAADAMRLLFILFFFSTAVWKIRAGGIFNWDQMSGILLSQHNYLFLNDNPGYFKELIAYLIEHPAVSYCLYLAAFVAEFAFIIGLFTKKYDWILLVLFLSFATFNYLLMNINYFSWMPFLGCLHFTQADINKSEISQPLFSIKSNEKN